VQYSTKSLAEIDWAEAKKEGSANIKEKGTGGWLDRDRQDKASIHAKELLNQATVSRLSVP
jgi:hypothetical protein